MSQNPQSRAPPLPVAAETKPRPECQVGPGQKAATITKDMEDDPMVTIRKNPAGDNPYRGQNPAVCGHCHSPNCPCFAAGSSTTYRKTVRELKEVFGWRYRNPGRPPVAWSVVLNQVQTFHRRKGA